MNYGTSLAGRAAQANGRAPASVVAGWIGCGVTAAWIKRHVVSTEWHHAQANLGGDGRPVDYYDQADVVAAWLSANYAARRSGAIVRRRVRALLALAREQQVASLPAPAPLPTKTIEAVEPVGAAELVKREYRRERRGYTAIEVRVRITGAFYKGAWLVWDGGRCKRSSVLSLVPSQETKQ